MVTTPSSLVEAIEAADEPGRALHFVAEEGKETRVSYRELRACCRSTAGRLLGMGLRPGDRLGVVLPDVAQFAPTFLGAVLAGLLPVPLPGPRFGAKADEQLAGLARVLRHAGARGVVMDEHLAALVPSGALGVPVATPADLGRAEERPVPSPPSPTAAAYLQFTSGSTAAPKGVVLTHANVMAHAAMASGREGFGYDGERDRGVSWLPMYHDMGLVAFLLWPLVHQMPVWYLSPFVFAKRPAAWAELVHRVRGTVCFAPNFAYDLLARRASVEELERWDLSCWRLAVCGAEQVRASTMRSAATRLGEAGLPPTALTPGYGMAEATLAMSFSDLSTPPASMVVDAFALQARGTATEPTDRGSVEVVSCGRAIPGHELRIVDAAGRALPERRQGEIAFRGPSVAAGYFEDAEATATTFRDGWLHTGDLGYLADGCLYITGRQKDLIIVRGENLHPHDVEWCVDDDPDVRPGRVVAFSVPGTESEELVVAFEPRPGIDTEALNRRLRSRVSAAVGVWPSQLVPLAEGEVRKTSSGKLQRAEMRRRYLDGDLLLAVSGGAEASQRPRP